MKRVLAVALTALALFGTAACNEETASNTSNPVPSELSVVQRTLDAIESDMADDPAP